jgi:hypothetical protein
LRCYEDQKGAGIAEVERTWRQSFGSEVRRSLDGVLHKKRRALGNRGKTPLSALLSADDKIAQTSQEAKAKIFLTAWPRCVFI